MHSRSSARPERTCAFISCVIDERAHRAPKLPTHKLSSVALRRGCSPPQLGGEDPIPRHGKGDKGHLFAPSCVTAGWPSTVTVSQTPRPSVGVEGNLGERPSARAAPSRPAAWQRPRQWGCGPVLARVDGGPGWAWAGGGTWL